jgi:hypothetical protein
MLSEELLRMLQADREREILAARRAHDARSAARRPGRLQAWLSSRGSVQPAEPPCLAQTGRAATDPSA